MIQRVQSLYLLVASVLSVAILISGIFLITDSSLYMVLGAFGVKEGELVFDAPMMLPVGVLTVLTFALDAFAIFQYKNRNFQSSLVKGAIGASILLILYISFLYYSLIHTPGDYAISPLSGSMHTVLIVFANFLALRGIKKDEALVKSVDRLR